jgi:D-alanyl-D-alanine dipeptidase
MKKSAFKLFIVTLLLGVACSKQQTQIPDASLQLILALADSVNGTTGSIAVFEREHASSPWKKVVDEAPMVIGRNGLAWGKGMHQEKVMQGMNLKKEGDGRTPAGMFELAEVFGYAPNDSINMPFLLLEDLTECVDDRNSRYYNQILKHTELPEGESKDWKSSEKMREMGVYYEQGVIIKHNESPIEKGAGSCIFLHNWSGPESSTAGCTAMKSEKLTQIIQWLSVQRQPVFVLLTQADYKLMKRIWDLP